MRTVITLVCALAAAPAQAQTWADLQAVPRETSVRVFEAAGKGWTFADGKLLLVKDSELTILRHRRPVVIPKAEISRVEGRHRDPPWEGMVIGALVNILVGTTLGSWQGCTETWKCALGGIAFGGGLGAYADWQITTKRTVYRAP